ncbi:MAG: cold shock domain-containing protein [Magnetococcales bacterium]|nr:cold shock domain-containing protein [Magnetococcales bacterium]
MQPVEKTFLQARVFNADQTKKGLSELDWGVFFADFIDTASRAILANSGGIVRLTVDGIISSFTDTASGVQAAIDMQEAVKAVAGHSGCAIGVATGLAYEQALSDKDGDRVDYFGTTVDIAHALTVRARGNAILIHDQALNTNTKIDIHSTAGKLTNRHYSDYFVEQPHINIPTQNQPIPCYSIFWQSQPSHFLTETPIEETPSDSNNSDNSHKELIYFGRVSAFKKERGFGFIQFYTEDQEYSEIYFHMTYVINQAPVQEHDHVQFTIKPGKEDRPQACSVLVMGSRLQGQIESQEPDGSGHITIHNQDFGLIRFFAMPKTFNDGLIKVNDVVEFTVSSGSDTEGLIAIDVKPYQGEDQCLEVVGSGDNLRIGSIERAVITVYFAEKGYGFAKCRRNNVYVHVSELTNPENIPNPGDIIEFEVFPGRDGTYRANSIRLIMKKGLSL